MEHISSVSKSCFLSIRDLRRIRNTLDYAQNSFIPRSTTVTLTFSIFLAVNVIACNLFLTPQLELFLKPLASAISHPYSNLYTASKLISASSTKFSLSTTKHFNLKNFPISTTFSTFKLTLLFIFIYLTIQVTCKRQR